MKIKISDNQIVKLPIFYRKLTHERKYSGFKEIMMNSRTASFKNYEANRSGCHYFYKPISKILDVIK